MPDHTFATRFEALTGNRPFPWQVELFEQWFAQGRFPRSCSLPAGLGKTSVIPIWLIALADRPDRMPRRLVYVVNRRTVVDQTTDEVEKLRKNLYTAGLNEIFRRRCSIPLEDDESPLAVSTLRGQFAENREWSADPSRPAVICGTVDMIGSRLLFSGYRAGFKTKPLYAGFLGQDVLLVHDEAHLESAFQELLNSIEKEQKRSKEFRPFHVMELSATLRRNEAEDQKGTQFELTDAERKTPDVVPDTPSEPIHFVWRRLQAAKSLHLHEQDNERLADLISTLALKHKNSGRAVLIFVRMVEDVDNVLKKLPKNSTEQLTGTLRGLERDRLVKTRVFQRFLPESNRDRNVAPAVGTAYLVCTSAGEVGVNISADHMVCDLSTFESMLQRFGRVNRFGVPDVARIDIVHPKQFGTKEKSSGELKLKEIDVRRSKTLALLRTLNGDASPKALGELNPAACLAAFSPVPRVLPATDILFDAWALTTIREKLSGRPPVQPYLHGLAEWEPPQTYIAWRDEVEVITAELLDRYNPEDLLDDYPLKPHELLRDRSDRVFKHLQALAREHPESPVWLVDPRGHVVPTTLRRLSDGDRDVINWMTVLLSPSVGGVTPTGTLNGTAVRTKSRPADAAEEVRASHENEDVKYDVADEWYQDEDRKIHRRRRVWDDDPAFEAKTKGMRLVRSPIDVSLDADDDEGGDSTGPRYWHWYTQPRSADDDLTKTFTTPIAWHHHTEDVTKNIDRIVNGLNLPTELRRAFTIAAKCHDLGKKREVWQRSIGNPNPIDWHAKSGRDSATGKLWKPRDICPDYRHEFGSLLDLLHEPTASLSPDGFAGLSEEMKDLVLHLIAAHHGRARPHFPVDEAFDPERTTQEAASLTVETPRRFARLQRRYGRWGLAYLESLLRAADYAASINPSTFVDKQQGETP